MSEDTLHIGFNIKNVNREIAVYSILSVIVLFAFGFFVGISLEPIILQHNHDWQVVGRAVIFSMAAVVFVPVFASYPIRLWKSVRENVPALEINHHGLVDNASYYSIGQLKWEDLKRIYPTTLTYPSFSKRRLKIPWARKFRGIAVVFQDPEGYAKLLKSREPLWGRVEISCRAHSWFFIPEGLLDCTAEEAMLRLNRYYVDNVRDDPNPS